MSITTELSRIQTGRNTIRNKLIELGLANSTANLDALAAAIENIVKQGATAVNVKEGETYTIPAGYHDGTGTVAGVAGGGNYSLQAKTVTPTKKQQAITSDEGYYGLSGVTVGAIPDAYQDVTSVTAGDGDVLTGKIIVSADGTVTTGTMPNNGAVDKVLDVTVVTYTIPKGFHSGAGKVSLVLETKTVTPTKAAQDIKPAAGKVLSKVTVEAIPEAYQDVTGVTAGAADVRVGEKIVTVDGTLVEGTQPDNGAVNGSIDGMTVTSFTIPAGITTGGTVSLTGDIEAALAAI